MLFYFSLILILYWALMLVFKRIFTYLGIMNSHIKKTIHIHITVNFCW